jgi:hypothetical protein
MVCNCAFPSRTAGTILPGVTGLAAFTVAVFFLEEFFADALPTIDFFAIAIVTLPLILNLDFQDSI